MTEAMKHRLIGAVVLVALGVIAWPVIFDSSPVREISQRSQIPEEPVIERFSIDEPTRPQLPPDPVPGDVQAATAGAAPAATGRDATPPRVARPAPAAQGPKSQLRTVAPVTTDPGGLPQQWAVQLGVFSQLANARDLQQRANAAGFHAILQSSTHGGTQQHRVFVNPKLDRIDAEATAAEVHRKLGVDGYVTRYYP